MTAKIASNYKIKGKYDIFIKMYNKLHIFVDFFATKLLTIFQWRHPFSAADEPIKTLR